MAQPDTKHLPTILAAILRKHGRPIVLEDDELRGVEGRTWRVEHGDRNETVCCLDAYPAGRAATPRRPQCPRVLVVTDRGDAPDRSPLRAVIKTLESSGLADVSILDVDACGMTATGAVSHATCGFPKTDVLIVAPMASDTFGCRFGPVLHDVTTSFHIPYVVLMLDSVGGDASQYSTAYPDAVLYVTLDTPVMPKGITDDKTLLGWTPYDPAVFKVTGRERDLPVVFLGSFHEPRLTWVQHLHRSGVPLFTGGGFAPFGWLSGREYAQYYQRAHIALNLPPSGYQINGHLLEALLCGACAFEHERGAWTAWLEVGRDCVTYADPDDLVEKIWYYLLHETERLRIAEHGCETAQRRYSACRLWTSIFDRVWPT